MCWLCKKSEILINVTECREYTRCTRQDETYWISQKGLVYWMSRKQGVDWMFWKWFMDIFCDIQYVVYFLWHSVYFLLPVTSNMLPTSCDIQYTSYFLWHPVCPYFLWHSICPLPLCHPGYVYYPCFGAIQCIHKRSFSFLSISVTIISVNAFMTKTIVGLHQAYKCHEVVG